MELVKTYVKTKIAKKEFESDDDFMGICGEIFITRKHNLVFRCLLCDSSMHDSFQELLDHISQHTFSCTTKIEELFIKEEASAAQSENIDIILDDENREEFATSEVSSYSEDCKAQLSNFIDEPFVLHETILTPFEVNICKVAPAEFQTKNHSEFPDNSKNDIKCNYCDLTFSDRLKRYRHHRTHIQPTFYKCLSCGDSYKSTSIFRRHMLTHRLTEFVCSQCPKKFTSKVGLVRHEGRHNDERKHKCDVCGHAFKEKSNLRSHKLRHTSVRKYACSMCPKRFYSATELRTHEKSHTDERPYICTDCGERWRTASRLNEHMKRHTNRRPYKCESCDKSFFNGASLKLHSTVHTQERNVVCDICNDRFKNQKGLVQHMRLHANKRNYICRICNKGFNQGAGLFSHLKSAHKIEGKAPITSEIAE